MPHDHADTWVDGAQGSRYDVDNLPYGVFSPDGQAPRVGVRVGEYVLDLAELLGQHDSRWSGLFDAPTLNPFLAAGPETWANVRSLITSLLTDHSYRRSTELALHPIDDVELRLPIDVGDYVDFYASLDHATNVGTMFRPDGEALLPNWRHLPVGYHGRAGTIVASGTGIHRPCGQRKVPAHDAPTFGPTEKLDLEAELGFVVGRSTTMGQRVMPAEFDASVFGVVGLNDWSARDIQAWEYVPLGPFLGKSFATSIAAWVTPLAALTHARVDLPTQDPPPMDYLAVGERAGYDIEVEIAINKTVVARAPYRSMYWGPAQMLAHMTVNGATLRAGDLYGSGTISGKEPHQRGSLLELSWNGTEPIALDGGHRSFLADGDEVVLHLSASGRNGRLGMGEVRATILPALPPPGAKHSARAELIATAEPTR